MPNKFEHGARFTPSETISQDVRQHTLFKRRILPWAADLMGATVLDAATGDGYYANLLAQYNFNVIAQDISEKMVKRTTTESSPPDKLVASADLLPYRDSSVNGILLKDTIVFFHPEMREKMFQEFSRVLSPEGSVLIISELQPNDKIKLITSKTRGRYGIDIPSTEDWRRAAKQISMEVADVVSILFPTSADVLKQQAQVYFDVAESTILYNNFHQTEGSEWHNRNIIIMKLLKKENKPKRSLTL